MKRLEQFAKEGGFIFIKGGGGPEWGGPHAYTTDDKLCTNCGFNSKRSAIDHWLENSFGDKPAQAIRNLIEELET